MNDEIKKILFDMDLIVNHDKVPIYFTQNKVKLLLDYITNLQRDNEMYAQLKDEYEEEIKDLQQENERLKGIAHKMHLWIFLNSGNEQKVYNELGLTDEENTMLGYSGQIRIGGGDNE